jgi:hypothetical protein|mmetsp:Transcript_10423/g.19634  ORF Transcript_10423/g.19634 Transcript_10423/m.19634 type:complete len:82 (-) Transcript_10423:780-1025(-)|eukprot:CAMPEP_0174289012 /NCGR_PEP_ID=MMETSP0809-20121228/23224_1 /TAXON_ID=73025 ORGANISM="Eutreptiella gymnastica-like, Strain CCMP1594" /NCGR_SAMPLE_ID=MMETSP0809 /ASSEMBLY_ACC=CAM_ASM_000658 /LENGTH=81 /DNA_ID=CAMNT_0015386665 /DNA_START=646 /DNA_END=891 /DNA_ORIENTATION=+
MRQLLQQQIPTYGSAAYVFPDTRRQMVGVHMLHISVQEASYHDLSKKHLMPCAILYSQPLTKSLGNMHSSVQLMHTVAAAE